jgi:glucokinase
MSESNLNTEKLIGVEVSRSAFKALYFDESGNLTDALRYKIDKSNPTFPQLANFLNEAKNRFGGVDRIGIAVPGLVHHETKRIAYSTFIPEHETIDFLGELEAATNLKITIENDANAAAYGEYKLGAGRGSRSLFFVTLGTGVGGALIFDGEIWRGAAVSPVNSVIVAINSEGMKLEDVASSPTFAAHEKSVSSGQHFVSRKLDEDEIRIASVVREAKMGDDFAALMLRPNGNLLSGRRCRRDKSFEYRANRRQRFDYEAENLFWTRLVRRARELTFRAVF